MNRAKGRQHTRKAGKRAALRLNRAQKVNAKKVDRAARIKVGSKFRHSSKGDTPSDDRRRARRIAKFEN